MAREEFLETARIKYWRQPFALSAAAHLCLFALCYLWGLHPTPQPIRITIDLINHGDELEPVHEAAAPKAAAKAKVPLAPSLKPANQNSAPQEAAPENAGEKSKPSGAPSASPSELSAYVGSVLRLLNAAKVYPRDAQLREEVGIVELHVEVLADGTILKSLVEKPSVFSALNQAALSTITKVGKLPAPPGGAGITLHVPIHFKIEH